MPVAVTFSGRPSVSRRWQARVVVSGLPAGDDYSDLVVHAGSRADATPPTKPADLTLGRASDNITAPLYHTVKTLIRDAATQGRWTITQSWDPEGLAGLAVGSYVYYGVSQSIDPDDDFLAVSAPRRAVY